MIDLIKLKNYEETDTQDRSAKVNICNGQKNYSICCVV